MFGTERWQEADETDLRIGEDRVDLGHARSPDEADRIVRPAADQSEGGSTVVCGGAVVRPATGWRRAPAHLDIALPDLRVHGALLRPMAGLE